MNSDRLFISELLTVEEMREVCALTGAGLETISFSIAENLDRLEEYIEDELYDDYSEKPEEEYAAAIKAKLAELEPFWTKVIAIYASN